MGGTTLKPRGALESFVAVASLSGVAFGIVWKVLTGAPADASTMLGLGFGILAATFTVGKLTEVRAEVEVTSPEQFLVALQAALAEQGLFVKKELPSYRLFESIPEGTLSLGPFSTQGWVNRVRVSVAAQRAVVVGPRSMLEEIGLKPAQ